MEDNKKIQQQRDELFGEMEKSPIDSVEQLLDYVNAGLKEMQESGKIERVDSTIEAFEKEVLSNPNLMTPQEAGRATYKTATPNKDGMKLIIDEAKLDQVAREGFKEMGQEEK